MQFVEIAQILIGFALVGNYTARVLNLLYSTACKPLTYLL